MEVTQVKKGKIMDLRETNIDFLTIDSTAIISSAERKYINRLLKLKEKYSDEVEIVYLPEENDGIIIAHVPKHWIKINPPRKIDISDEQRKAIAQRFKEARKQ